MLALPRATSLLSSLRYTLSEFTIQLVVDCKRRRLEFDGLNRRLEGSPTPWESLWKQNGNSANTVSAPYVDSDTYARILQGCLNMKVLAEGRQVHGHMIKTGCKRGIYLETKLLIMSAKCGSLVDVRQLFDKMLERNVVSCTALIGGYARHGQGEEPILLFYEMQKAGIKPNQFSFANVLTTCASLEALEQGKQVHGCFVKVRSGSNMRLESGLVDMYAKCGCIVDARQLFDEMTERDAISCTVIITAYAQDGQGEEALKLFNKMQCIGLKPNQPTFASVLQACAGLTIMDYGKQVHSSIVKTMFESNAIVGTALLDMYSKCGSLVIS